MREVFVAGFRNGIIRRWSVALRSKPHKDRAHPYQGIIADLPRGTLVQITGQQDGWLAVTAKLQGRTLHGYVSQETVEPSTAHPSKVHYELVPYGDVVIVKEVPAHQLNKARNALTGEQLQKQLSHHSVPTVPQAVMAGYYNSLLHVPAFERHAPALVAANPKNPNGWRGSLGELSAKNKGLFPPLDLNIIRTNHPVFDLKDPFGGLNSVKTSVPSPGARGAPHATYLKGLAEMLGLKTNKYNLARESLYPDLPAAEGKALMMRNGYVTVNANDVKSFRAALEDPANYTKKAYWQLADQLLTLKPVSINGKTYLSYQALRALQLAPGTTQSARQTIDKALRDIRQQLAGRVKSNGITTRPLVNLQSFRLKVERANPTMTPGQLEGWLLPELLMLEKHGGGLRGNLKAGGISGGRGSMGGMVVAMAFEGGGMLLNEQLPPDAGVRLGKVGFAGGASGLAGGLTETLVAGNMGSAMARQLISKGAVPRFAASIGRGFGSAAGGSVAAPVFSMAMLAMDDQEHSTTDYVATGTRALVGGTVGGILTAMGTGALAGSVVPGLGTVAGIIIGGVGYFITDYLVGDKIEQGVRRSMGP
ncbi:hypothetical protein NR800_11555 [Corallococcus interemptor]|uniref:hypothetical protein n=1 Tax=Corallococcus interemptor TaxID=2316720 RepID=UPI0035D449A9